MIRSAKVASSVGGVLLAASSLGYAVESRAENGDFNLNLGLGAANESSSYVSIDDEVGPRPMIMADYGQLFLRGSTLGYRVSEWGGLSASVLTRYRMDGYDAGDSEFLAGMDDRDGTVEAGLSLAFEQGLFDMELNYLTDVGGVHEGQEMELSVGTKFMLGPVQMHAKLGAEWLSDSLSDYYYGVEADEATAGRSAYDVDSALNYNAGIEGLYRINRSSFLRAELEMTQLDSAISDSPIVDDDQEVSLVLGYMYRF